MSNGNHDHRSELEAWMDIWDEQESAGVHPKAQEPARLTHSDPVSDDRAQDLYFDYLDTELLQEDKTPNPVYPDSVGKDSDDPKPVWVSEDLLKEIENLKQKLFSVENKMAEMGNGKKWHEKPVSDDGKKIMSEIESLRKKIDAVSDQLGIKDEPSPWVVDKE